MNIIMSIIAAQVFCWIWGAYVSPFHDVVGFFWCFVLFFVTNIIHSYIMEYVVIK